MPTRIQLQLQLAASAIFLLSAASAYTVEPDPLFNNFNSCADTLFVANSKALASIFDTNFSSGLTAWKKSGGYFGIAVMSIDKCEKLGPTHDKILKLQATGLEMDSGIMQMCGKQSECSDWPSNFTRQVCGRHDVFGFWTDTHPGMCAN